MPSTNQKFSPKPNEDLTIQGQRYVVQPNPRAPGNAYCATGRRASVYRLQGPDRKKYALKVFKSRYANASLLASGQTAARFQHLPGMLAARRVTLGPADDVVMQWGDLRYSCLMPWIGGITWNDVLAQAEKSLPAYNADVALKLCRQFLQVMAALGQVGAAHTDIAPGNVFAGLERSGTGFSCTGDPDVQLVDLEDLYISGLAAPQVKNIGTDGYRHISADQASGDTWCIAGDRYAATMMAAEILLLGSSRPLRQSFEAGVFGGNCGLDSAQKQMERCLPYLRSISDSFADRVQLAWNSPTLMECPEASDLLDTLPIPTSPPVHGGAYSGYPKQPPPTGATTTQGPVVGWRPITGAPLSTASGQSASQPAGSTQPQSAPVVTAVTNPGVPVVWNKVGASRPLNTAAPSAAPPPASSNANPVQSVAPSAGAPVVWSNARPGAQPAVPPPFVPAAPPSTPASAGSSSGKAWIAIMIIVLVILGIIAVAVIVNSIQNREKVDADVQRWHRESEQQQEQQQAHINDQARSFDEYTSWLMARADSLKLFHTVIIKNGCKDKAIVAAIRFTMPDDEGRAVTMGWFKVEPGTSAPMPTITQTKQAFLYAVTTDGASSWGGSNKPGSLNVAVAEDRSLHFVVDDGHVANNLPMHDVNMYPMQFTSWGDDTYTMNCNASH